MQSFGEQPGVRPLVTERQGDTGAAVADWVRVSESKARLRQMVRMRSEGVGFNEIEFFLSGLEARTHCRRGQGRTERQILYLTMTKKIDDERGRLRQIKAVKDSKRGIMRDTNGRQSNKYKKHMRYLFKEAEKCSEELTSRYQEKIQHLRIKHSTEDRKVSMSRRQGAVAGRHQKEFPNLHIYKDEEHQKNLQQDHDNRGSLDGVMVIGDIQLSREEKLILRLPPKMTINPKISSKAFQNDCEQGMSKIRWSRRKELEFDRRQKNKHKEGLALDVDLDVLGIPQTYQDLPDSHKLDMEREEATLRQIYDYKTKSLDMSKKSINDSTQN